MNIKPLADRVVIEKPSGGEQKLDSGLYIAGDAVKAGSSQGTVVAVGPGKIGDDGKVNPMSVKEGDRVLYSWGDTVEVDGKEYEIVSESSILAILD